MNELRARDEQGVLLTYLRSTLPFPLEGEMRPVSPLIGIKDPSLFQSLPGSPPILNPKAWKSMTNAQYPVDAETRRAGYDPAIILLSDIGAEVAQRLSQTCVFDSLEHPEQPPTLWWNAPKDLTASKLNHVSQQAFYLRRYSVRVADLWEQEYGRRPAVTATTRVSLNGRPYQALVDPDVDLARVSVSWFSHNPWVRDLETPRIPTEVLTIPGGP